MSPLSLQIDPGGTGNAWQTLNAEENATLDATIQQAYLKHPERTLRFVKSLLDGRTMAYMGHLIRAIL